MASRQERRKAERDAAKRAPAQAGAARAAGAAGDAGAAGAAAALANLHVNPVGDWSTQEGDPDVLFGALGAAVVKQKAGEGDRAAQYSLGCRLLVLSSVAAGADGTDFSGAAGGTPRAEVGSAHKCTFPSLTTSPDRVASINGHQMI